MLKHHTLRVDNSTVTRVTLKQRGSSLVTEVSPQNRFVNVSNRGTIHIQKIHTFAGKLKIGAVELQLSPTANGPM